MDDRNEAASRLDIEDWLWRERLESVPDWIWELDVDLVHTYSNRVCEDVIGYKPSELLGKSALDIAVDEDRDLISRLATEAAKTEESYRNLVLRFRHKDGSIKTVQTSASCVKDAKGRVVGFRGITRDITEQAAANQAAAELLANFRAVTEDSPTGIFIQQDDTAVYANSTIMDLLGYMWKDADKVSLWDLIHPDDVDRVRDYYERRVRGEESPDSYELRIITKSGEVRQFEIRATTVTYNGEPAVLGNVVDITERKRAEEALSESRRFLQSIYDSIQDGISILDKDFNIVSVNKTMERWYPHALPLIGRKCYEAYHGRNQHCAACPTLRALHELSLHMNLVPLTGPHGEIAGWLELYAFPLRDEEGNLTGVVEHVRNVTDRVRAEERLTRMNECILGFGPDPIANINSLTALAGQLLDADVALYDRLEAGMIRSWGAWHTPPEFAATREPEGDICYEVMREGSDDVVVILDLERSAYALTDPAIASLGLQTFAGRVVKFNGTAIGVLCCIYHRDYRPTDEDKQVLEILASAIAVEERRRESETSLRESEERFRSLYDAMYAGVIVQNATGRVTHANRAAHEILGVPQSELIAAVPGDKRWVSIWFGSTPPERPEHPAETALRTGEPVRNVVIRTYPNDPRRSRWLLINSEPILDPADPGHRQVISTFVDVTERMRTEEALEAERNFVSTVLDIAGALVIVLDPAGRVVRFNRACEELTGYAFDEVKGTTRWKSFVPTGEIDEVEDVMRDLRAGMYPTRRENHWVSRGGRWHLIDWTNTVITDSQGEVRYIVSTGIDITERRQALLELAESEERYRRLVDLLPDAVVVAIRGKLVLVNEAALALRNASRPEEMIGTSLLDTISPDYREMAQARMMSLADGTAISMPPLEEKFVRLDGTEFDGEIVATRIMYKGEPATLAVLRDITERKRAEESRRALEKQLESQKRHFYRETILSVTDGKLDICEPSEIRPLITGAQMKMDVRTAAEVPEARHAAEDFCRDQGLALEFLAPYMIGVGEAITNAIKHAGGGRVYAGMHDGGIWVGVADRGKGISSLILPRATLLRGFSTKPSLGLGYTIMLEVADKILLKTSAAGTTVILMQSVAEPVAQTSSEELPDLWRETGS